MPTEIVITYKRTYSQGHKLVVLSPKRAIEAMRHLFSSYPDLLVTNVEERPRETGFYNKKDFPELW